MPMKRVYKFPTQSNHGQAFVALNFALQYRLGCISKDRFVHVGCDPAGQLVVYLFWEASSNLCQS